MASQGLNSSKFLGSEQRMASQELNSSKFFSNWAADGFSRRIQLRIVCYTQCIKLAQYTGVMSDRMFRSGTAEQNPMMYDYVGRQSHKLLGEF
jgi:hypothetical protein